jgi:hypothetical protein
MGNSRGMKMGRKTGRGERRGIAGRDALLRVRSLSSDPQTQWARFADPAPGRAAAYPCRVRVFPLICLLVFAFLPFALIAQDKPTSIEKQTKVHRLNTGKRAPFDAFVYVNRIPEAAEEGESPSDLAGRIYGRLANQEGRILLKLPPGMDRKGYLGFKTFLGSEGNERVQNCVACHAPADFTDSKSHIVLSGASAKPTPSLRNLKKRNVDLEKVIRAKIAANKLKRSGKANDIDDAYARMTVTEVDIPNLVSFLNGLNDVADKDFRDLILNAKLLDTSVDIESGAK